jgi:uroporphyrinogen decarboxylase
VGVDWRIPLSQAREVLGPGAILQGNLDPAALLASKEGMERMALEVLRDHPRRSGHVFNLGHGVLPETDPQRVKELVEFVHRNGESR